jgi:hypothetical protein
MHHPIFKSLVLSDFYAAALTPVPTVTSQVQEELPSLAEARQL